MASMISSTRTGLTPLKLHEMVEDAYEVLANFWRQLNRHHDYRANLRRLGSEAFCPATLAFK